MHEVSTEVTTYEGMSYESFEDAVANAGVPQGPVPTAYDVTLRYVTAGGVVGRAEFRATLRLGSSLQES